MRIMSSSGKGKITFTNPEKKGRLPQFKNVIVRDGKAIGQNIDGTEMELGQVPDNAKLLWFDTRDICFSYPQKPKAKKLKRHNPQYDHQKIDNEILTAKKCPYCGNAPELVDSTVVYGKSYGLIWLCSPCRAWVGVHKTDNKTPLGRLANAELRDWKKIAHENFDPIWKDGGMTRNEAYDWMAIALKIPRHQAHIGMLDVMQCRQLVTACMNYKSQKLIDNNEKATDTTSC